MAHTVIHPDGSIVFDVELSPYKPDEVPKEPFQTTGSQGWWWRFVGPSFNSDWYPITGQAHRLAKTAEHEFDSAESFYDEYRKD